MSVLVAYAPERSGASALGLGQAFARALGTDLIVLNVLARTWPASPAYQDGDYRTWIAQKGQQALDEALAQVAEESPGLEARAFQVEGRSAAGALLDAAEKLEPELVVLGSGLDGLPGRIMLGTTANRVMHSSPVPVAVAPRGYEPVPLTRMVTAWSRVDPKPLLGRMADFAKRANLPVELVTFGRVPEPMYPPEVGFDAEADMFRVWQEEALTTLREAAPAAGLDPERVALGTGSDWRAAVGNLPWAEGDILALGSHPGGPVRRVFLGSTATRIMRHSPVPVLVFPG
ncbi:universal stress protein [Salana multivorans]